MPENEGPETRVTVAVVITRRQQRALRAAALADDRSVSWVVRAMLDRWFGFAGDDTDAPYPGEQVAS